MTRLRFLTWLMVPAGLFAAYAVMGLPHIRATHTWLDEGQGYDPYAPRFYISCSFWGPLGRFRIDHPQDGTCPWIIFKRPTSSTKDHHHE